MKINYLLVSHHILRARQNLFAPIRYTVGLVLIVCVIAIGARGQSSVNPSQPGSENPGAPDGSYLLSDFETINLYSGKAYFNLPLLKVAGRGGVSHTISLPIKPRDWYLVTSPLGGLIPLTDFKPSDCEIISAVWLPNGLSYRLRYTSYAELARVELPTGGAIEYDFSSTWESVSMNLMWHRLVQRRTYKPELESKTTYSSVFSLASPAADSTRTVTVDNFIPGSPDVRLNREKHYFFSPWANTGIPWQPGGYRPWKEGLEYQVESFHADATTLLKRVTTTWQQRQNVSWWPLAGTSYPNGTNAAYEPANGSRVSELKTEITDVVPSLISKQTFGYDDTVPFNNRSHLYEYDFGAGASGALLRLTVTGL